MTPARFADEVRTALDRVTELQLRAQQSAPEDAQRMLVESLEELTTAFAELDTAQEELRSQNELLAAAEFVAVAERDRYRDLFEGAPDGYLVTDKDGVIAHANDAARRLLNVRPLALVNKPLGVFVPPDDKSAFLTRLTVLRQGDQVWKTTLRLVPRGEGTAPRTVDATVVPFKDPETQGRLLRWQLRDVTDQRAAADEVARLTAELDAARRADDRRLRFLAEASALFLSTLDCDATLRHVGERVVPFFGDWCFVEFADPAIPDRCRPLVLAEPGQGELVRALGQAAGTRPTRTLLVPDVAAPPAELSPAEADRVELFTALGWNAALWLPLEVGGELVGGLAVGSARKARWAAADVLFAAEFARHVAAALRNAERCRRFQDIDRRKDEFVSVLAHELRNPLTPLVNAVQILHLRGVADPVLQRAYGVIDRQTQRLSRLIDDVLDVARITQGKIRLRTEPIDLGAAAEAVAETVRPKAVDRGVKLVIHRPDEPIRVEADPGRFDQVAANLLDNAVKFTPAGGTVTLTVRRDRERAELRVADTGVGIAPEVLPHVFDLYSQADRSLGDSPGGLGIGLSVVRELVRLHGGTVTAHSGGPGRGSEFVVALPAARG